MAEISNYKDIIAWQKAHQLVLFVYQHTSDFPDTEKFSLLTQMRRSAISIPANIAEGFARRTLNDSLKFYNISIASLAELDYYFLICKDLDYFSEEVYCESMSFSKMVGGLIYKWSESQKTNAQNPNVTFNK